MANLTTARVNATEERILLAQISQLQFPADPAKLPPWAWTPHQWGCQGCSWCNMGLRERSRGFFPPKEWKEKTNG